MTWVNEKRNWKFEFRFPMSNENDWHLGTCSIEFVEKLVNFKTFRERKEQNIALRGYFEQELISM